MMRSPEKLLLPLGLCLLMACNRGAKGILPRDKMGEVMTDLVIAEEFAHGKAMKDSSLNEKDETIRLYTQVLELHKTSRQEFMKSFDYYLSKPEIARAMFDSLSNQARRIMFKPGAPLQAQ